MKNSKWMVPEGLKEKRVAVTGATGVLGTILCRRVLAMGGEPILVGRSAEKLKKCRAQLEEEFPGCKIHTAQGDLEIPSEVRKLGDRLTELEPDILYLNAGDYYRERTPCRTGLDPVFQINFLSQFYLAQRLLPGLNERKGRLLVTGSIAALANTPDPSDPDYAGRKSPEAVYGNAKRWLMTACGELAKKYPDVQFAAAHPGVTPTGITSHYPGWLRAVIKIPMKLTFLSPEKASLGMTQILTEPVPALSWVGPGIFSIWGFPRISALSCSTPQEREQVLRQARELVKRLTEDCP